MPIRTSLHALFKILPGALFSLCAIAPAKAQTHSSWPDAFLSRVEIVALIQTLNASLLSSRSATATLENWCAAHRMSPEPKVTALRLTGPEKPPSDETRQRLGVSPGELVKHRHVRLSCGGHVLSEADNWYVPSRLPQEANRILESTDTPFGKAVQSLQPFRRTFEAKMKWSPLPDGWELGAGAPQGGGALAIPHELFEHRAILYASDRTPFSEVHETYTSEVLDFDVGVPRR
ncbi:MAG: hypothetical protein CTY15_05515 [Methylocystis sp.]|nr:MAG: hypothetical protein CTY15_05515 [Methylocystis sp.]